MSRLPAAIWTPPSSTATGSGHHFIIDIRDVAERPAGTVPYGLSQDGRGVRRHCTYCIIPKLRGRQKSRFLEDILNEARQGQFQTGVRELVLVSQETTAYGKDFTPSTDFAGLLESLAGLAKEPFAGPSPVADHQQFWIRFLYGHPESLDQRTIAAWARHACICSYIDVPIQHASRAVLKRMGRQYGPKELYAMVDHIRRTIPDVALRTTVIVGFPGETDAEFGELVDFVETVQFDHLGCFLYSDAEDLPSHALTGHVSAPKAKERYRHLMKRQQNISAARNRNYRDQTLSVLIEEHPENGVYTGRTEFQAPEVDGITYIHADNLQTGSFAAVRITTDTLEYGPGGNRGMSNYLKNSIFERVNEDLAEIESELARNLRPHLELVSEISRHILFSGGKRLRPLLMVISARLCGYGGAEHQGSFLLFSRFLHAATLLHDDVVDGARLRRGNPVAHAVWDSATAVLAGDFLLARSLTLAAETGSPRIIRVIAEITENMSQGEIHQLARKGAVD